MSISTVTLDWNTVNLLSLPVIGALIGWFTNYVAVKMLFRPTQPVRIFGVRIQGLVPKRQVDLAEKIAETVEQNLISHRDVQEVLQSPEAAVQIERLIEEQIDIFLREKLRLIPMIGSLLQGEPLNQIKALLVAQFRSSVPEFIDGMMRQVEASLSFRDIVRRKVESFDLLKLEQIIYSISSRELRMIEILGGVLGFIVGLIQLSLLVLTV